MVAFVIGERFPRTESLKHNCLMNTNEPIRRESNASARMPDLKPLSPVEPRLAPVTMPGTETLPTAPSKTGPQKGLSLSAKMVITLLAIGGAIYGGGLLAPKAVLIESDHPNWKFVQEATDKSQLILKGSGGGIPVATAKLSKKQVDNSTNQKAVAAIKQESQKSAVLPGPSQKGVDLEQVIIEAQQIPEVVDVQSGESLNASVVHPEVSQGMKDALINGDASFFHLFIYDCCAEDGDIVEVQLNGRPFAMVPITHLGATLSIPLVKGQVTSLAIRGVRDGGGGITVAFQSSEGEAFLGILGVNQVVPFGLIGG